MQLEWELIFSKCFSSNYNVNWENITKKDMMEIVQIVIKTWKSILLGLKKKMKNINILVLKVNIYLDISAPGLFDVITVEMNIVVNL